MIAASSFLFVAACDEGEDPVGEGDDEGQADTGDDYEAPASCKPLLDPLVGSYPVTSVNEGEHTSTAVLVHADGSIAFDADRTLAASEIVTCYDRTMQDHDRRVQVSYGADDDGPVINLYVTADLMVTEVEYRHRNEGQSIRVDVGPVQDLP